MKVSGFTIVKNAVKFGYPAVEAIRSILPVCDEFIVNVGKSEDDTLALIKSINDPKIKIIETEWDTSQKPDVLSYQTNVALEQCSGDWAFYLQSDEVIHEGDLPRLAGIMQKNLHTNVDALQLKWLHFYGSYYRYRIDQGWFQKQVRIIRNNKTIESCKDAWTFCRKDGSDLSILKTNVLLYHYGWVQAQDVMSLRRQNAKELWNQELTKKDQAPQYDYGDLNRFPAYFGPHPKVMEDLIAEHDLSRRDREEIARKYWWHPFKIFRMRNKTFRRVKERIA